MRRNGEEGISSRPKKVVLGFSAYSKDSPSGLNRFSGSILSRLLQDAGTEAWVSDRSLAADRPNVRAVGRPFFQQSNFRGNTGRLIWNLTMLPRLLAEGSASVFFSPLPEGMVRPPCAQVVTVHDVLPLLYPETYPRLRHYFQFLLPKILDACQGIVVNSETTRHDLIERLGTRDAPIHVVPFGYDPDIFFRVDAARRESTLRSHGLDQYVLAVGETRPYKNIRRLIEAFAAIDSPHLTLALAGDISRRDPDIVALPGKLGITKRVRFLGRVSDEELAALYSGARAFVFPSLYEGFGLPAVEAMACGCPVIASRAPALVETCGDAARFVDPLDVDSIAEGIDEVTLDDDLRASLRERGHVRSQDLPITDTADRISDLLAGYARGRSIATEVFERNTP